MIDKKMNQSEVTEVLNSLPSGSGKGFRSQYGVIIRRSTKEGSDALYADGDKKGKRVVSLEDAVGMIIGSKVNWTHYAEVVKTKPVVKNAGFTGKKFCCGQPMTRTVMGWVCDECDSVK